MANDLNPEKFLDKGLADVQDEGGVLTYYSEAAVLECIAAALQHCPPDRDAMGRLIGEASGGEVARYSFVCNEGCGVCAVKVTPFEYERTETLEGEHIGSKYQPQIVSSCCGAEVHVYDNEADHWGAEVTLAAKDGAAGQEQAGAVAWINFPVITKDGEFAGYGEPELSTKRLSYGYDWDKAQPLYLAAPGAAIAAREQEGELLPTKDRIDAVVMLLNYLLGMERHHHAHEWETPLARTVHALEIAQTRKDLVAHITLLATIPTPASREEAPAPQQSASTKGAAEPENPHHDYLRRYWALGYSGEQMESCTGQARLDAFHEGRRARADHGRNRATPPPSPQAETVTDAQIKTAVSAAIGFDWKQGELQPVNAHDLFNIARAVLALTAAQPADGKGEKL